MRILLFFLVLFSFNSFAVDFVYRVDSRPPGIVFRDGFRAHGNNHNLQQHIRGDSCAAGSRDSFYIATTSDIDETYRIARQYYSSSGFTGRMYRYRIRADNRFYSLQPSVDYLTSVGVVFTPFERIMMREQREYVALSDIPVENIAEAVQLDYDVLNSRVTDGPGTSNPRYLSVHTESNRGIIPSLPVPQVSVRERIMAFGALISACLSTRGVRQPDENYYAEVNFYDARLTLKQLLVDTK
ncbi:pertussis toxin-like subunit ArtA [Citrobacter sp. Cb027]|uniref:scabin-related ADP-ribosyltransferase n=1 Tax=Citrobacter sp. Cb027 TaxID=2985023 RepID=UPI00257DAFA7|nr:pertussis toxin-like subunit ArtA [Citrobacter sp. Cb027]MDM3448009.1 pertussis toxin-like subunit ArtA [Citrobacter sp. Cb027]